MTLDVNKLTPQQLQYKLQQFVQTQHAQDANREKAAREKYIYSYLHSVCKELYCKEVARLAGTSVDVNDDRILRDVALWAHKATGILGDVLDMVSNDASQ